MERPDVQHLDARSVLCALAAVALVTFHQVLWRFAREMLGTPLWEGATLTVTFIWSALVIFIPVLLAGIVVRKDGNRTIP